MGLLGLSLSSQVSFRKVFFKKSVHFTEVEYDHRIFYDIISLSNFCRVYNGIPSFISDVDNFLPSFSWLVWLEVCEYWFFQRTKPWGFLFSYHSYVLYFIAVRFLLVSSYCFGFIFLLFLVSWRWRLRLLTRELYFSNKNVNAISFPLDTALIASHELWQFCFYSVQNVFFFWSQEQSMGTHVDLRMSDPGNLPKGRH